MSRWKELPAELDVNVRQLVVRLRRLKDHSGLSMRQLAAKTEYSAKSWERYLGGRTLPPRDAVAAMARIGGEDPTRILALHEVAAETWGDSRADASAPEATAVTGAIAAGPETTPGRADEARPHGRSLRFALVAGAVALVLASSSATLLVVRLTDGGGEAAAAALPATTAPAAAAPTAPMATTYTCRVERVDGRWYAGHSRTRDAIVGFGHSGPDVAEVQCLLRRAGIELEDVDGIFGPLTERAVERAQKQADLVVDGIVGPHTWKVLRGVASE